MEFNKVLCVLCVIVTVAFCRNLPEAGEAAVPVKTTQDIIQVTPLKSDSGLYFQYINKVKFIESIWSFVIEMDHGAVFQELIKVYQSTVDLEQSIHTNAINMSRCTNAEYMQLMIKPLKNRISAMVKTHALIDQKLAKTPKGTKLDDVTLPPPRRRRRGAFDFVGHIDKFLFGIMDADDAHTLHKLANSTNSLNKQVAQLTDELIKLTDYVDHETTITSYQEQFRYCEMVSAKLNMFCAKIDELENLYIKLDRAVDSAKLNHLNSLVLTPERLLTEMRKMQDNMGTFHWPVPSPLTLESMHGLIDTVVNTHVFVTHDRKLLFIIEVPLVEARSYDLYHTIPLPFCNHTEKCAIVLPDSKYLGVSTDQRTYVRLDDFKSCKYTDDGYLCYSSIAESQTSLARMCDIRLFTKSDKDVQVTRDCDVRLGRFEDVLFYPIADYNNWLYVMQHDTNVNVQCHKSDGIPADHKFDPIKVSAGVGVIRAIGQETCKLHYKYGTLPIHQLKASYNSSIIVKVNIGSSINLTDVFDKIDSIELENAKMNVNLDHSRLREMTIRLEDLRRNIANNTKYSGDEVNDNSESHWLSNWFSGDGLWHTIKTVCLFFVCAVLFLIFGAIVYFCCISCSVFKSCCNLFKKKDSKRYSTDDRVMHNIPTLRNKKKARVYVDDGSLEEEIIEMIHVNKK
uniref:F protein n=1 Tax=Mamestra configurata nucleopolyhedrovirus TaxID=207830 RepID=A0A7G7Y8X4_NPVMC|nr:F protein [Mamestra configurata nucleopolyhedrovirus A]